MRDQGHDINVFDQEAAKAYPPGKLHRFIARQYFSRLHETYGAEADTYLGYARERVETAWAAARHSRRAAVTHVHCHDPVLAHAFHFFSRWYVPSVRWGFTAHGFGRFVQSHEGVRLPGPVIQHLQAWENAASRNANWVMVPSHAGLAKMAEEMGLGSPLPRWYVVPHARPEIPPADGREVRQQLGLNDEALILAVGQLIPIKRFHLLLQAVSALVDLRPHVLILGEGQEEITLQQLAEKLGLADRLHITTTDAIAPYLAAADLYVSLSSTESYGMANCEAIAAGLPAVCTAVGAVPEVVGDGAWLVGESQQEVVAAINTLLRSKDASAALSTRARLRTSEWWSANEMAKEVERIYLLAE